jgi:hypothetical protein
MSGCFFLKPNFFKPKLQLYGNQKIQKTHISNTLEEDYAKGQIAYQTERMHPCWGKPSDLTYRYLQASGLNTRFVN